MQFEMATMNQDDRYRLLVGLVVPRPIAFVSTLSRDGIRNAAPFSFFNLFGAAPPIVVLGINGRGATLKDSARNIIETGEFVINVATADMGGRMNACAVDHAPTVDEFEVSGLTPRASIQVQPPGIAESPASLECRLQQLITVGPGANLIVGEVVQVHVEDGLVSGGKVDQERLDAIGRLGGAWYARTRDLFQMPRLAHDGVSAVAGFDEPRRAGSRAFGDQAEADSIERLHP